jgi:AcrR family transcriptional regulator
MARRPYRLGLRQAEVDRTRGAILAAARELLAAGDQHPISVGAVARRAGVSRLTIYNRFGSRAGVLNAVLDEARDRIPSTLAPETGDPRAGLRGLITESCRRWASDPSLFRRLPEVGAAEGEPPDGDRALAGQLAAADQLRPGCSLREAEDVIGALTSFGMFDRLHKDGRRSTTAVAEILMRLAGAILAAG